ncbi:MAG: hypothetical protein D6722_01385 [Bacteroidetes bacterium]|nr:MAG: hypothetical protein D6722_01385 [Bacteroidota bacterium]
MHDDLIDTWHRHQRINLYLLDGIVDEGHLQVRAKPRSRTIGTQFAHLHNVRLMWLQAAGHPGWDELHKAGPDEAISRQALRQALTTSGEAIAGLLDHGLRTGRIKGFKPHPAAFLGYLISHESHHRGQIILQLKQAGHPLPEDIRYGIWDWGRR